MTTVACLCPPRKDGSVRHPNGETITLRAALGFRAVTTIRWALSILNRDDPGHSEADKMALLTEQYVLAGVESWSVVDATNQPVPVTSANLREILLTAPDAAQAVGDDADGLYSEVIIPLLVRVSESSPATPTDDSTSASPTTPTPLQRPSKPSSTSITRTGDTETTTSSRDGDSSSSQSSGTAA